MEERLELILNDQDKAVCVLFLFLLLPAEVDLVLKEESNKRNSVGTFGFGSGKVILILLTKVIAFYLGFTKIYI